MSDTLKIIILVILVLALVFFAWSEEIHIAAQKGDLAAVKAIVESGAESVDSRDADGRTPLHLASRGVHIEVIRYLVDNGADLDALDSNQIAPLHSLTSRNHSQGIELLLSRGADIDILDYQNNSPLHYAAMSNHIEAASILVENGASLELKENYGRTPLILCARERGGPEMTRLLLEAGAEVNAKDRASSTPLELAAWRGKAEVVDILLEAGAEIPTKGSKATYHLIFAAAKGLTNLFNTMVKKGADITIELSSGGSLMHEAAAGGSLEILKQMAGEGLDINKKDQYGWTPLHYAAKNGHSQPIEWMIGNGADIDTRNSTGETPYNIAVFNRQKDAQDILAAGGADTNPAQFPLLEGDYLGQKPPEEKPEIFALGIVSSIWGLHSTVVFSPDGREALWTPMVDVPGSIYTKGIIFRMKRSGSRWSAPEPAPFSGKFDDDVPFFAPDGMRLFFISSRSLPGIENSEKERIWYVDRIRDGYSDPQPLDRIVNDQEMHWQFSVDRGGDLYFGSGAAGGYGEGDIYVSRYRDGQYIQPQNLGPSINTEREEGTPFISPDGSYLIFQRSLDLYLSFLQPDGSWGEVFKLEAPINTTAHELCPIVSPDGKYLFFNSSRGGEIQTWWVDAGFIDKIRAGLTNSK